MSAGNFVAKPEVPDSVQHLDHDIVVEVLSRHGVNVSDAAGELGVASADLRRLLWANPKLTDAAVEIEERRLDLAEKNIYEALRSFPLDWAMTQNNLGNALSRLGEWESGTARLEEAVAAYRAALEERTRERVPLDWAASRGNQGVTLMLIADRTNSLVVAETAVRQIETAYETLRSGGHEQWAAYFEAQLAKARSIRDRLEDR
jgi:tetratricopeptide (TPR) repeat protein